MTPGMSRCSSWARCLPLKSARIPLTWAPSRTTSRRDLRLEAHYKPIHTIAGTCLNMLLAVLIFLVVWALRTPSLLTFLILPGTSLLMEGVGKTVDMQMGGNARAIFMSLASRLVRIWRRLTDRDFNASDLLIHGEDHRGGKDSLDRWARGAGVAAVLLVPLVLSRERRAPNDGPEFSDLRFEELQSSNTNLSLAGLLFRNEGLAPHPAATLFHG